jgi:hypothetical protein
MDQSLFSRFKLLQKIEALYYEAKTNGKNPDVLLLGSETYLEFIDQLKIAYPMQAIKFHEHPSIYMGMTVYVIRYDPYLVRVV